jgi:hypothetical protein
MPKTYEPIATNTLGSATASVTFSSIPATYTDLVLVLQAGTATNDNLGIRFNSDTGSNYSNTALSGNGTTVVSFRASGATSIIPQYHFVFNNNLNSNVILQIQNYSNATTNKTLLARSNNAGVSTDVGVGLWRNTAAITSVTLIGGSFGYSFITGSTFTLYGVKSA